MAIEPKNISVLPFYLDERTETMLVISGVVMAIVSVAALRGCWLWGPNVPCLT